MSLTQAAVQRSRFTWFALVLLTFAGAMSYFQLGQLEDPEFTVKTAAITVNYPGATAEQVELEVVDLVETALQEMVELKHVYSMARPGQAISWALSVCKLCKIPDSTDSQASRTWQRS